MDDEPKPQFSLLRVILLLLIGGILFGMLAPGVNPRRPRRAPVRRAINEMVGLAQAIKEYRLVYNRLPIYSEIETNSPSDFTFGTSGTKAKLVITNGTGCQANNAELTAALLDLTRFGNGTETLNRDHALNPRRLVFLDAHMANDTKSPGVGADGVYRDPWGNPYIVTLDLNSDGRCRDAFYRLASVSSLGSDTNGLYGLSRSSSTNDPDTFEAQASVIVWSFGPDGKADPSKRANEEVNKDNVLRWRD